MKTLWRYAQNVAAFAAAVFVTWVIVRIATIVPF